MLPILLVALLLAACAAPSALGQWQPMSDLARLEHEELMPDHDATRSPFLVTPEAYEDEPRFRLVSSVPGATFMLLMALGPTVPDPRPDPCGCEWFNLDRAGFFVLHTAAFDPITQAATFTFPASAAGFHFSIQLLVINPYPSTETQYGFLSGAVDVIYVE